MQTYNKHIIEYHIIILLIYNYVIISNYLREATAECPECPECSRCSRCSKCSKYSNGYICKTSKSGWTKFEMNDSKMAFIYFGWPSQLGKCYTDSISVNGEIVQIKNSTKYLGAYPYTKLDFKQHIKAKCKATMLNLHRIKVVRKNLTRTACNKLDVALVLSHLDYTNSLLGGLPKSSINKMQTVQNMAAKITLGKKKYDSTTSCLVQLHWLLIKYRIDYKIRSIVHKCLHAESPPYLARMIEHGKLRREGLHSEIDTTRLLVPRTSKKTFAARSFSVLGPQLWNKLPTRIRKIDKSVTLKKELKTHLFKIAHRL